MAMFGAMNDLGDFVWLLFFRYCCHFVTVLTAVVFFIKFTALGSRDYFISFRYIFLMTYIDPQMRISQ